MINLLAVRWFARVNTAIVWWKLAIIVPVVVVFKTTKPRNNSSLRAESMRFHAPYDVADYTVGCDAEGRLTAVRARPINRRRQRRIRERRRQGARARGWSCLRPHAVQAVDVELTAVYTYNLPVA